MKLAGVICVYVGTWVPLTMLAALAHTNDKQPPLSFSVSLATVAPYTAIVFLAAGLVQLGVNLCDRDRKSVV